MDSLPIRALGKGRGLQDDPTRGGVFTSANLQTILRQNVFANFTNMLETQPHNTGHVIVGSPPSGPWGHMADGLSPLDPIFWMHHCMVDFMWARWQKAGNITQDNNETYKDMFVNRDGRFITFTSKGVHDFESLGYTYDIFVRPERFPKLLENAEFSHERQIQLAAQLRAARPMSLAAKKVAAKAEVGKPTSLTVQAPTLLKHLKGTRVFRMNVANKEFFASEQARVLAVLKGVSWPEGASSALIVNVFVNNPEVSRQTPATDPSFAGSFSFFGSAKMAKMMGGIDFVIDITAPLAMQAQAGKLSDNVNVQLVPLNAAADSSNISTFTVSAIEIITT